MKHLQRIVLVLLYLTALHVGNAQVPQNLSYQGVLTDSVGTPKPDGSYSFTFRLYESLSGGSPVGTQAQPLNVKRGLFHTVLDQVLNGLSLDRPYWLGIQVGSDPELSPRIPLTSVPYSLTSSRADTARYALSAPQQALVDSARIAGTIPNNAVSTGKLQDAAVTSAKIQDGTIQFSDIGQNGAAPGQVMKWNGSAWVPGSDTAGTAGPWQMNGSSVFYSSGFVGVGRSTPLTPSEYFGVEAPGAGGYGGMYIRTQGASTRPFYGYSTPSAAAWTYLDGNDGNKWKLFNAGDQLTVDPLGNIGIGTTSPAHKLDISGTGIIRARVNSDNNAGLALSLNGQPGWSVASVGSGQFQIYNDAIGQNAFWIDQVTNNVGIGTFSPSTKVHAVDSSPSNDAPALYGQHAVTDYYGVGVKGEGFWKGVEGTVSTSGSNIYFGVRGEVSQSGAGGSKYGVYGTVTGTGAGTKYGVFGTVDGSAAGTKVAVGGEVIGGVGIGVRGTVTANDVNSNGVLGIAPPLGNAVFANGRFSATGLKAFQIDHPLDPANKMLFHYCSEGPDPLNVYSGTVHLDGTGEAWIVLPEYFQNININFRYQLTPIGASMPDLFVAEEVQNNRFKIGGGKPGMKVSWQVSGTRNDLYAQRAGIHVEVEKTGDRRGKYLVPELFDMPESMGIFWTDRDAVKSKSADGK